MDADFVWSLVVQLRGASGPSGLGTDALRILVRHPGSRLAETIALLIKRIAEEELPPGCLGPLTQSRLVALGKKDGGVRPVGVGEALRRLVGKAIAKVCKNDLIATCGAIQLCAGTSSGCEASARALQQLWDAENTDLILLVDASNAFNRMSREQALRTVDQRCPVLSVALRNLYGHPARLIMENGVSLLSEEGTTQGCPLGMAMFAVASLPLIALSEGARVIQSWYADDSAAGGKAREVRAWFDVLHKEGPKYGYDVCLRKTIAIVKPDRVEAVKEAFGPLLSEDPDGSGILLVTGDPAELNMSATTGHRYLGAGLGATGFRKSYVQRKVQEWTRELRILRGLAAQHPHQAYTILTRSVIPKWRFVMRSTDVPPSVFEPLEEALQENFFLPALGWRADETLLRRRCALPARLSGLGIPLPTEMAKQEKEAALAGVSDLCEAIMRQDKAYVQDRQALSMKRHAARAKREELQTQDARELLKLLSGRSRKALEEALDVGNGFDWLSHAPLDHLGLSVDRQTFRDAIALRMGVPLPDPLPDYCPSCGAPFDIAHALKCKSGDWVRRRHNEVAQTWMTLFKRISPTVQPEPHLAAPVDLKRPTTSRKIGARADIFVTGLARRGQGTFLDVAVLDTGAECHVDRKALQVLQDKERRKRDKYEERAQLSGATFVPLVCSIYGTLAPEAAAALASTVGKLDEGNAEKRSTGRMLRVSLQISILKATSLCIRSRSMTEPPQVGETPDLEADCAVAHADARPLSEDGLVASQGAAAAGF